MEKVISSDHLMEKCIFPFLDEVDLIKLANARKDLRWKVKRYRVTINKIGPEFTRLFFHHIESLTIDRHNWIDKDLIFLRNKNELLHLNMMNCLQISGDTIMRFNKLKSLNIQNCLQISNKTINAFEDLISIDVQYCYQIDDNSFDNLRKLQIVKASGCKITDNALMNLKELRELTINNCNFINGSGFVNLKKIQKLEASNCLNLTDEALMWSDEFQSINVSFCHLITGSFVRPSLSKLKFLNINWCCQFDGKKLSQLTGLIELKMWKCQQIIDDHIQHLDLILLDASHSNITDISLSKMTKLQVLDVSCCDKITDKSISKLIELKTLRLNNAKRITSISLNELKKLSHLDFYGTSKIELSNSILFNSFCRSR